jgi:hypothetical protein
MTRKLIGLPFRIGVGGARLAVRGLADISELGYELISTLTGLRGHSQGSTAQHTYDGPAAEAPPEPRRRPTDTTRGPERPQGRPTPRPRRPPSPPPSIPRPTPRPEPPAVVRESADPGAADGAGAQVRVAEPWEGYDGLGAKDVIERLSNATAAELAAVQLYEAGKRRRKTVLAAAERQLSERSPTNTDREGQTNG